MRSLTLPPDTELLPLQEQFVRLFPNLRIDASSRDTSPRTSIRDPYALCIRGDMTVAELERALNSRFGVQVRIMRWTGYTWYDTDNTRHWTLNRQNQKGEQISQSNWDQVA